jgi:hypothetical protein
METVAVLEKSATKTRGRLSKVLRIALAIALSLAAMFFIARLIWRFSGSNQWEMVRDGSGVKIYALKAPGSDLNKFKGVVRVRATMARILAWMQDPDVCKDAGCYELKIIENVDDHLSYSTFRLDTPPFRTREYVIRSLVYQSPQTKELLFAFSAAPDKIPPNDCCFRVTEMNNLWRFTPQDNGEVQVEYFVNMNPGGFMPDMAINLGVPTFMFDALSKLQSFLERDKYKAAKYPFLLEK